MKVREIMTTDVMTADPDTTLETIATMMRDEDVGAIPIVDDDELVGIVTDRDIVLRCIAEGKDPAETTATDVLSEDLETASPDTYAEEAAEIMSRQQVRRLPVVEDGQLVGMVSIGDIAVKERDERVSGGALEGVSRGVRKSTGSAKSSGKKQPGGRSERSAQAKIRMPQPMGTPGRGEERAGRTTGRQADARAEAKRGQEVSPGDQGISNRTAGEELERNARVVPFRESKTARTRRKAS
ncbi:MAG TPA: CBS domain-containing protein [Clostridia bacterium]|nr:CBS domain-containing protein [Clostridia bacterium]